MFLANQRSEVHKLLSTVCQQREGAKELDSLNMDEVNQLMMEQYDHSKFVISERYKFWNQIHRKPEESIRELSGKKRPNVNLTPLRTPWTKQSEPSSYVLSTMRQSSRFSSE